MAQNSSTANLCEDYDVDFDFKLVVIGDYIVGKSNLVSIFTRGEFLCDAHSTVGVDFAIRIISLDNKRLKAQIWDTAGQKRYRLPVIFYYRLAAGVMLVYDISKRDTFENIDMWLTELRENADADICIMLVGNKSDLSDVRDVTHEEAAAYARQHLLLFWEVSAKTSENVEEAFINLIAYIYRFQEPYLV